MFEVLNFKWLWPYVKMTDISVKKYLFCTYTYNFSLFRKEIEKHVQFRKNIRPSALQLEPLL